MNKEEKTETKKMIQQKSAKQKHRQDIAFLKYYVWKCSTRKFQNTNSSKTATLTASYCDNVF